MSDEAWQQWQSTEIGRLRRELARARAALSLERRRTELWRLRAMERPRPWRMRATLRGRRET